MLTDLNMTSAQRYWLSGFLVVFALALAVYFLEWTSYDQSYETEERLVLPLYTTYRPHVVTEDGLEGAKRGDTVQLFVRHGIYVRHSRNIAGGVIFGGLLPLVLIGGAGFIAFGRRRPAQR